MLRGHGGEIYHLARKLGLNPSEIKDHSSNVSPLPPPQGLYDLLKAHLAEIENLPEVDSFTLREKLAQIYSLHQDQILPSSGTTEWIFGIPKILNPKRVIILGPTYSDYADAAKQLGIRPIFILAEEETLFSPPLEDLTNRLQKKDLVFICNPNNPTGALIPPQKLQEIIFNFPDVFFIIDESYSDFVEERASLLDLGKPPENTIILRSFSKIYRIPGLRLGFAIASQKLSEFLWSLFLPWNVNRLAQVAGNWLLDQKDYIIKVREFVKDERKRILKILKDLPLKIFPSRTHFFLLKFPHKVHSLWKALLYQHHILTRDASNIYGLNPYFLRFALRSREENDYFCKALKEVFNENY